MCGLWDELLLQFEIKYVGEFTCQSSITSTVNGLGTEYFMQPRRLRDGAGDLAKHWLAPHR
jgi:hypothetical protein